MARAVVIRAAGTNCDAEMVRAFEAAGADARLVRLDALIDDPASIRDAAIIGFPGGFSFGDDIASGRVFATFVRQSLYGELREAAERGSLMIGVCNGFQILTQVGLLPGPAAGDAWPGVAPTPSCSLIANDSGRFIDRWVSVRAEASSPCVWTSGLSELERDPARALLPIANGEGRFVAPSDVLARLEANGQIALRYAEPVNGSAGDAAGVCDTTGRIFGLMPHPERYTSLRHHPYWTRLPRGDDHPVYGLAMFRSAVIAAGANLSEV